MNNSQKTKQGNSIKKGDIFSIGNHIIACGDSRDKEFVKKVMKGKKVSVVIADVPYGIAVTESKHGFLSISKDKVIQNDHIQSDEEYKNFTKEWIEAVKPYLQRKNSFYIFNSDRMIFALREGMHDAGCRLSQLLIWIKNNSVMGRLDYLPMHELIAFGWVGVHEFKKSQDRSVIFYPKPDKSPLHPTMKPVGLIERLILNSTDIGDIVYDPFLGSGTAAVASEATQRKCIGIEIDEEYCRTALTRMETLFGLKAKLI